MPGDEEIDTLLQIVVQGATKIDRIAGLLVRSWGSEKGNTKEDTGAP